MTRFDGTVVNRKRMIGIGFILLFVLLFIWAVIAYFQAKNYSYEYVLTDLWDVYIDGEQIANQEKLDKVKIGSRDRLTNYDLYTMIPYNMPDNYSIEFRLYLCSVEAYVDGVKVYDYASDLIDDDVMIGSGYHYIHIPENSGGKQLWVHIVTNEDNAMTGIAMPRAANSYEITNVFAGTQTVNSMIGMFLILLGILLFVIGGVASFSNSIFTRIIFIGIFSFLMGTWSIITNCVSQIYSMERVRNTSLEYVALYFAPSVFGSIMWIMRKDDKTWRKIVISVSTLTLGIFAIAATVLHIHNIVRLPSFLPYFHVLGLVAIVALAYAVFLSVSDKDYSESVTAMAVILLIGLLGFDIVRFNIQKYILMGSQLLACSIVPIAALSFVILLIVSYLIHLYELVMTKAEREALTELAYRDILTGSYNRAKFEATMKNVDESGSDFAIINMDLNGLKSVNDTYGHAEGDILIQTFAGLLRDAFTNVGMTFRVGGDEFIVLVDHEHFKKIDDAIERLISAEEKESAAHDFDIDTSYGIAYKSEVADGLVKSAYSLADERMYAMKELKHNSRPYKES